MDSNEAAVSLSLLTIFFIWKFVWYRVASSATLSFISLTSFRVLFFTAFRSTLFYSTSAKLSSMTCQGAPLEHCSPGLSFSFNYLQRCESLKQTFPNLMNILCKTRCFQNAMMPLVKLCVSSSQVTRKGIQIRPCKRKKKSATLKEPIHKS